MKNTKIIAMLLAAVLCAGAAAGCNKTTDIDPDKTNTDVKNETVENNAETTTPEAPADGTGTETAPAGEEISGISNYDWKYSGDEVMMTIGGRPIKFDEYRYFAMSYKSQFDNGDDSYWTKENSVSYNEMLLSQLKQYAGITLLANNVYDITLSDENYANIDATYNNIQAQYGGEEMFNTVLDMSYMTGDFYRKNIEYNEYITLLLAKLTPKEDVEKYAKENYAHVQHVLVSTLDEEGKELTGDELAKKTELANEITKKARDGEDFYSLVEQYGEDPGMVNNPDGYTFTTGEMVEEFEKASFALAENDISDPVKTSYGYHIIKKLPLDIKEGDATYQNITYTLSVEKLSTELVEYIDDLEVKYTDAFNDLTMANIRKLKPQAAAPVVEAPAESAETAETTETTETAETVETTEEAAEATETEETEETVEATETEETVEATETEETVEATETEETVEATEAAAE